MGLDLFEGDGKDHLEYEALSQEINPDILTDEPRLFRSKWFDYRWLHPVRATYLFAHMMHLELRVAWERYVDYKEAPHLYAFKATKPKTRKALASWDFMLKLPRDVTCFFRARQFADDIGCPYDFYLRHAYDFLIGEVDPEVPAINRLYQVEVIERVMTAWEDERRHKLFVANHPRFLAENFIGNIDQIAHNAYLLDWISGRPWPLPALNLVLKKKPVLPMDLAIARFGQAAIDKALALAV